MDINSLTAAMIAKPNKFDPKSEQSYYSTHARWSFSTLADRATFVVAMIRKFASTVWSRDQRRVRDYAAM